MNRFHSAVRATRRAATAWSRFLPTPSETRFADARDIPNRAAADFLLAAAMGAHRVIDREAGTDGAQVVTDGEDGIS